MIYLFFSRRNLCPHLGGYPEPLTSLCGGIRLNGRQYMLRVVRVR